jgi:hypothetical protein
MLLGKVGLQSLTVEGLPDGGISLGEGVSGSSGFSVGSPYIFGYPWCARRQASRSLVGSLPVNENPRPFAWVAAPEAAGAKPITASATRLSGPGTREESLPTFGGHPRRTRMNRVSNLHPSRDRRVPGPRSPDERDERPRPPPPSPGRAAEGQIPVVILMAQGDEGTRQRCLEAGAAAFLVKPFRAEMLLARIYDPHSNERAAGRVI